MPGGTGDNGDMGTKTIAIGTDWAIPRQEASAIPWTIWCCVAAVTLGHSGRALGHLLASIHRAGRFLDAAAHRDLLLRRAGRFGLRVADPGHHLPPCEANEHGAYLGLHAPLGAFIISWGGAAMLTSAPFDDWWHNAYGLDTKILSPPHVLLILRVFGVMMGTMMLIRPSRNPFRACFSMSAA